MVAWHYPIHNDDMFFVAAPTYDNPYDNDNIPSPCYNGTIQSIMIFFVAAPTASGHRSGAGEAGHHERAQLNYRGDYHHRHHHYHH